MYYLISDIERQRINHLLYNLEYENMEYLRILRGSFYYKYKVLLNLLATGQYKTIIKKLFKKDTSRIENGITPNYFSHERIAIYTCITDGYDLIQIPVIMPNNCDFYVVTDNGNRVPDCVKYIDIDFVIPDKNMNAKDKNRYIKMHPEQIFKEYNYSIYIDGNIKPISDFTKYINLIGDCGIATFMHPKNNCVFKECNTVIETKKATLDEVKNHLDHLNREGMPKEYGMADCGLIARRHNDELCIRFMNEWWSQYCNYSKRDQISFSYVAFKLGIEMEEITVLGNNMYKDYAVRRLPHYFGKH